VDEFYVISIYRYKNNKISR